MSSRFVHIDLDAFFAEAERLRNPTLRGRPVVVGGSADQRGVVHSASYDARARGVRTGMPLSRAHLLCPRAAFLKGSYPLYSALSTRLFDIIASLTPDFTRVAIDEATIRFDGVRRHWASAAAFADALRHAVAERLGLPASLGIASGRILARVACDAAKPAGILEVSPGAETAFLDPLPLARLPGVGPRAARDLERFNIRCIGELRRLPLSVLTRIFGEARGRLLFERAAGRDGSSAESPDANPRAISRETAFPHDTGDRTLILAMLHYLVERAGMRLRRLGLSAGAIEVRFRYGGGEQVRARARFRVPRFDDRSLFAGARSLWVSRHDGRRPVHRVGVSLLALSDGWEQALLFPGTAEDRARHLTRSVDRIRSRFGFAALTQGRSIDLMGRLDREETPDGGFRLHNPALTQ